MNASRSPDDGELAVLGVDVGGTFTDAVLTTAGRTFVAKAPTTPHDQSEAVIGVVGQVLANAGISPGQVDFFGHGMTVATNALLENRVAETAFLATAGFVDLVEIGRQDRPALYRLEVGRASALVPPARRVAVPERCGPDGVIEPLTPEGVEAVIGQLDRMEVEAVAICLLHSYRFPEHEQTLADALRERFDGELHVSVSHEVVGTFREYERASTTEIDAALTPLLRRYLERLEARCRESDLPTPWIMQSSGGLTGLSDAARGAAKTLLSGPAGGAAAARMVAAGTGREDLICFDMGGTSCDVSVVVGGRVQETAGRKVAGRPVSLPMVDIETVGAGGGSIAWLDPGGALRVGPESAGAQPGPACYGKGGDLPTVTDANLVLGHLGSNPTLSGIHLDRGLALEAIDRLAQGLGVETEACAEGILEVANAEMVRAIRVMTVERGLDPADFTLLAFGGAGPLHATAIADRLGIDAVLVPGDGGVLSAIGLASAERRRDQVETVMLPWAELGSTHLQQMKAGSDSTAWDMRYRGQSFELTVEYQGDDPAELRRLFDALHHERYGYLESQADVELVTVRRRFIEAGVRTEFSRPREAVTSGPEVIDLGQSTLWLDPGWTATGDPERILLLTRS